MRATMYDAMTNTRQLINIGEGNNLVHYKIKPLILLYIETNTADMNILQFFATAEYRILQAGGTQIQHQQAFLSVCSACDHYLGEPCDG